MSSDKSLYFNFVPDDPRFNAAAIDFVVNHRGCGPAEFNGDATDALTFLECYQLGDLRSYVEFLLFCQARGLPVSFGKFEKADA